MGGGLGTVPNIGEGGMGEGGGKRGVDPGGGLLGGLDPC